MFEYSETYFKILCFGDGGGRFRFYHLSFHFFVMASFKLRFLIGSNVENINDYDYINARVNTEYILHTDEQVEHRNLGDYVFTLVPNAKRRFFSVMVQLLRKFRYMNPGNMTKYRSTLYEMTLLREQMMFVASHHNLCRLHKCPPEVIAPLIFCNDLTSAKVSNLNCVVRDLEKLVYEHYEENEDGVITLEQENVDPIVNRMLLSNIWERAEYQQKGWRRPFQITTWNIDRKTVIVRENELPAIRRIVADIHWQSGHPDLTNHIISSSNDSESDESGD